MLLQSWLDMLFLCECQQTCCYEFGFLWYQPAPLSKQQGPGLRSLLGCLKLNSCDVFEVLSSSRKAGHAFTSDAHDLVSNIGETFDTPLDGFCCVFIHTSPLLLAAIAVGRHLQTLWKTLPQLWQQRSLPRSFEHTEAGWSSSIMIKMWRNLVSVLFSICLLFCWMLTVYWLCVHVWFTFCSRFANSLFTCCLLVVYLVFTSCLLLVYFLFTFCLLLVYFLFTSCLLFVYLLLARGKTMQNTVFSNKNTKTTQT